MTLPDTPPTRPREYPATEDLGYAHQAHAGAEYAREPHAREPYVHEPHAREPYVHEPHAREPHAREPYVHEPHAREPYVHEPPQRRRLTRPRDNRWIGGVCAGLGRRYGLAPNMVRLLFVLSCLLPGPQFLLYLMLWLIIPNEERPTN